MAGKEKGTSPTPERGRRRPYVHRLATVRGVRQELARLYKEARIGHLPPSDLTKLTYALMSISRVIEGSSLELRIGALEQRLEAEERRREEML